MSEPTKKNYLRRVEMEDEFDDLSGEDRTNLAAGIDYEAVKTGDELESYIEDIADTVRIGLDQSIAILTPWFFNNMPNIYYQTTPRPEKVRHLSAIITGHIFETKQTVELWDRDRSKVTYIGPGGDRKIILDMAHKLLPHSLKMGSLYFSRDKLLFLSTFVCSDHKPIDRENPRIMEKITAAEQLLLRDYPNDEAYIKNYLEHLDNDFVMYATAARIQITYRMVRHMLSHEGAHTIFEPLPDSPSARLMFGVKNIEPSQVLEDVLHLYSRYNFNVVRAFVIKFDRGYKQPITIMHFIVTHASGDKVEAETVPMLKLNKALRTLGWVDSDEYSSFMKEPYRFSINGANLVRSFALWVHIMLGKRNPYYFSNYKIRTTFFKYQELTRDLIQLFRVKFDPLLSEARDNDGYHKAREALAEKISKLVDEVEQSIYFECVNMLDHMLKTNYFLPTKTGLAFRISPKSLDPRYYPDEPFGIFFIVGRNYRMFHVRWKDISRGGLRVVMPRSPTDYDYALAGLFDEVYGLSHAQQLKNKDIPEGGSKAVLLLRDNQQRVQSVRGATNALLDLLVSKDESEEETQEHQISYYDKDEIIYLGPDENMTNDLIEWVPEQASRRGYRYAAAFMSSKPGAGINHKEYGVTSEGVNVFVHNTLHHLGIDPLKDRFTCKMTGGPDGDVAGNELKILYREYGENARVVAIADGFGAAFDANGLNWKELLRLVHEGLSINHFSRDALSKDKASFVIDVDTPEHVKIRNELHARVKADIFLPAGGRPYTVNERNWNLFLDEDGKPTCRAVVEGANIFFTKEARDHLQSKGVFIIKDSSANKTGVICSSYEIIASLTLSADELMAFKAQYVNDVIAILRKKADAEAKLLFREYKRHGGRKFLVELSMEISREINDVTDILLSRFTQNQDEILKDKLMKKLILDHCPASLVEKYKDRIAAKLPKAHKVAILSAYIASYIIYREGLGWLDSIPHENRFQAAITYMRQAQLTASLVDAVANSGIEGKEKIITILEKSAARNLTTLEIDGDM